MSSVLILRLAGPMQSWGSTSRFTRRSTEAFPTKSGIVGLLAAAQGRRRVDPIEDLAGLRFAARIDQPGEILRDFHTAHRGESSMPLSQRYYLSDAVFTAYVEGSDDLVDTLADALRHPVFPLYLGRRACPPTMPLFLKTRRTSLAEAVDTLEWQAARFHRAQLRSDAMVRLRVVADGGTFPVERVTSTHMLQDVPESFDSERRLYALRSVEETSVDVVNPDFREEDLVAVHGGEHDPMGVL
ncbi:MAG: type I-E CRISPR-associated protein Cas5/CasD [Actinomyces sp.]|nr:type I-E CRISPR-associated protein Cas5/CasD [Actinomyces sp.]MCI1642607.1 type I-E CRISPR-associated protein Cas5/CasD [Actinomyces sp.]MCI1663159.1 type I-E CRISPR-associated protein Cas5/CasD [Actinomyces sp.]MCI1691724.1 type I-E CRISPR-associated protein Cas5/CasD [Actinomyces sp.]